MTSNLNQSDNVSNSLKTLPPGTLFSLWFSMRDFIKSGCDNEASETAYLGIFKTYVMHKLATLLN